MVDHARSQLRSLQPCRLKVSVDHHHYVMNSSGGYRRVKCGELGQNKILLAIFVGPKFMTIYPQNIKRICSSAKLWGIFLSFPQYRCWVQSRSFSPRESSRSVQAKVQDPCSTPFHPCMAKGFDMTDMRVYHAGAKEICRGDDETICSSINSFDVLLR